jgi:hypothetical protein
VTVFFLDGTPKLDATLAGPAPMGGPARRLARADAACAFSLQIRSLRERHERADRSPNERARLPIDLGFIALREAARTARAQPLRL